MSHPHVFDCRRNGRLVEAEVGGLVDNRNLGRRNAEPSGNLSLGVVARRDYVMRPFSSNPMVKSRQYLASTGLDSRALAYRVV